MVVLWSKRIKQPFRTQTEFLFVFKDCCYFNITSTRACVMTKWHSILYGVFLAQVKNNITICNKIPTIASLDTMPLFSHTHKNAGFYITTLNVKPVNITLFIVSFSVFIHCPYGTKINRANVHFAENLIHCNITSMIVTVRRCFGNSFQ